MKINLLFLTGTLLSFEVFIHDIIDTSTSNICYPGSLAEWSKALVLGTSPKGRGFDFGRRSDQICSAASELF